MFKNKTNRKPQPPIKQLSNQIRPGALDSYGLIHPEEKAGSPAPSPECGPGPTKLAGCMGNFLDVDLA